MCDAKAVVHDARSIDERLEEEDLLAALKRKWKGANRDTFYSPDGRKELEVTQIVQMQCNACRK